MPALALTVSLLVLSMSALFVRLAQGASALDIGLWRMVIALPVLAALGLRNGAFREMGRLRRGQVKALVLCGFCLFLHWWAWFASVQSTTLANAMVLFATSPLFTALGAWVFFREPFTRRHALALAFCFGGICLVFRDSLSLAPDRLRGDALGFLASLLFSAYVLTGKGIRRDLANIPFVLVVYSACAFLFFCVLATRGELHFHFARQTWIALLCLAVGPTLLGHALFTYCLEHFNVNLMNILILVEPLLGSLAAYLVLGERLTAGAALGFATVSAGVLCLFAPQLAGARRGDARR